MNIFQAAQPALLYIVPAVLAAVGLHAHLRGEFQTVCMLMVWNRFIHLWLPATKRSDLFPAGPGPF